MTREDAKRLSEPRRKLWVATEDGEPIRIFMEPEWQICRWIMLNHRVHVHPIRSALGGYVAANFFHDEILLPGTLGDYYLDFADWDDVSGCPLPLLAGPFSIEHLHRFFFHPRHFMAWHCKHVLNVLSDLHDWEKRMDEMDYALSFDEAPDMQEVEPPLLTDREADLLDWEEANKRRGRRGRLSPKVARPEPYWQPCFHDFYQSFPAPPKDSSLGIVEPPLRKTGISLQLALRRAVQMARSPQQLTFWWGDQLTSTIPGA